MVGAVSISQRAVKLCGWGVRAGIVRAWVAVKPCDPLANMGRI